jgi:pimeloyl-ACP methyl ester carboxylesterase
MGDMLAVNGTELYVSRSGAGSERVVMAHGLLMDHSMFAAQRAVLDGRYETVAYDHRGQGQSSPDGPFDMDTLCEDAAALIRHLGGPVHFVGMSMGGFVGLRLAARYPELLRSLTLIDSSADRERWIKVPSYRAMQLIVHLFGPTLLVNQIMPLMFGRTFLTAERHRLARERWRHHIQSLPPRISGPVGGVISRADIRDEIGAIRAPTLIFVGADDRTTPPEDAAGMAKRIAKARLIVVPEAGHSSNIEAADLVNSALVDFLAEH